MKSKKHGNIKKIEYKKLSLAKNLQKLIGIHLHGTRGKETRGPRGNKRY